MKTSVVIKVLFLACLVFAGLVTFTAGKLPRGVSLMDFNGQWEFEKAEYLERSSLTADYQVKYEINAPEGLEKLEPCLHQAVKSISVSDIVHVACPYTVYFGRAVLVAINDPKGDRYLLTVGIDPEDTGKESPLPDEHDNIFGFDYWIERIDPETIAITKEATCVDNAVVTHSAVRSILKQFNLKKQTP